MPGSRGRFRHIGERADVIVCADQAPGYYPLEMLYDYACDLTPGHFIPPGFHPVSSCKFYGFLHYANETELTYGAPTSPKGICDLGLILGHARPPPFSSALRRPHTPCTMNHPNVYAHRILIGACTPTLGLIYVPGTGGGANPTAVAGVGTATST